MRHIAPHRWADAAQGRLPLDERAKMTAHAEACARCAGQRDRVLGARDAFGAIAQTSAPELRWEQIGARVYWSTSQERNNGSRSSAAIPTRGSRLWMVIPAFAAAAGIAATVWVATRERTSTAASAVAHQTPPPVMPDEITPIDLVTVPDPAAIIGLVTLAQGDVAIGGERDLTRLFALPVVAGLPIDTGPRTGRVAVQLDAGTAFAIGPDSHVALARLDAGEIRLEVEGSISIEVSHRLPDQRFLVVAGNRTVEVRGTEFEVNHRDGRVEVSCRRGLVAVRDAGAELVEVSAGTRWAASDDEALLAHPPAPLDATQLAELAGRGPVRLPAWTDATSLLHTTAPVAITAAERRAVRVDGVVVGHGELAVRVMSGRHLVETERTTGRFAPGQWVATRDDGTPVRVASADPVDDQKARRKAVGKRRGELERGVDRSRVSSCVRSLIKQGIAAGTHVVLEIGVDATGAVSFLNVTDTDLPASTAACIRDVVAQVRFPSGPAATWRHSFSF